MKQILFTLAILIMPSAAFAQLTTDDISVRAEADYVAQADTLNPDTAKCNAIVFPEAMTCNVDSLLSEWHADKYLIRDTTCDNPDYNPVFSDSVIMLRLRRMPTVMEMAYNDVVRQYIDQYTGRMRKSVAYMLGAANFYLPIFEEALDYHGLPIELKWLPVIESALNPKARSRAGAVGLWQFMLPTARQYGLKVNSLIDERQDPVKSSYAAARFLKDLYNIYGDWNLVIAAYNCGPGNVNKAIHRSGELRDYWKIYHYLPKETRGYVPAFIAANYAMTYYCEHNICPMKATYPLDTDTVMVHRDLHMEQVEALIGADKEMIKALNPTYRTEVIPGTTEPCVLRLPLEPLADFIRIGDTIYNHNVDRLITKRVRVDIADIKAGKSNAKQGTPKYVTVRRGDTLGGIARRNGTTVSKIKKLNGLKNNNIRVGRKLRIR